jgi:hypothetical protein
MAEVGKINRDAIKSGVEGFYSAVQTAEVITAVPQIAPVADTVLREAGYTPPQPAGVAPGLQQPAGGGAGVLAVEPVKNRHTGVAFTPGAAGAIPPPVAGNTHPNLPAPTAQPASPGVGAAQGIETPRADGVR